MKKITFLGHAAFKVEIEELTIYFDPWITGNPVSPIKNVREISKADLVLVSHDHEDHGFADAVSICKNTGATFVGLVELAEGKAVQQGVKKVASGNIGGEITLDNIKVFFTPALHSCDVGTPCGFVVQAHGLTVYHAGDTAFFSDMEWIAKAYDINVAILPIGYGYTMGPKEAAWAVEKLRPTRVIPCHYDTFPFLKQNPLVFKRLVADKSKVEILKPGESLIIK